MSLSKMLQEYHEGLRGLPTYEELTAIANTEPCADPIVERNVSMLRQRSTVGMEKYGTTLADNKLPLRAWLNHALEEALDQANYLQAAIAEIDLVEHALPPLPQYFPDVTNIRADEELRAQQYAKDYARSALAASPAQALTNKEIELAIALGKAQGTLRFIATVSKDKHIVEKAWAAATASPEVVPAEQDDATEDELTKIVKSGAEMDFPGFLEWIADRLVYVHKENNNVDYVQTLRTRAKQLRAAIAAKATPTPK